MPQKEKYKPKAYQLFAPSQSHKNVVCHYERRNAERNTNRNKSYIIKELLRNCRTTEEFKKYYDYITNLMVEEKVYSLSTFIKWFA